MIMDLNNAGLLCDDPRAVSAKELEDFLRKYKMLNADEIAKSFRVTCEDIILIVGQTVPCVGCRRSVERLFNQLVESGQPALDPLVIQRNYMLAVKEELLFKPQKLCTLLHGHNSRLQCLVESQPRSKKSRRCVLHSLETSRSRILNGSWREVWDCMETQCREEVTFINFQTLQDTLDNYLRKHRFCGECRTKVIRAYQLLVEEKEPQKEKGYVPALYSGIRRCLFDKHLHLQPDTDYITNLITRAEPELLGSFRERHAKTLEIAQEEVLICLGICLYERLHRISLRLREEEGTCQILAAVAIDALHRKFETSVERKCGVTKLELLYEEITKEEAAKQQRKEQKKLRRRKKKERKLAGSKCDIDNEPGDIGSCECIDCIEDKRPLQSESVNKINCIEFSQPIDGDSCISCQSVPPDVSVISKPFTSSSWSSAEHSHDCGYSSEHNNGCCDTISGTSSLPSSPEGSDVACSEGFCNHERGDCTSDSKLSNIPDDLHKTSNNGFTLSLEEMLMESDEENDYIPIEDIMEFKSRHNITEKRQELRETLRHKFAQLCCKGNKIEHLAKE